MAGVNPGDKLASDDDPSRERAHKSVNFDDVEIEIPKRQKTPWTAKKVIVNKKFYYDKPRQK
jgi:hypothetical protein